MWRRRRERATGDLALCREMRAGQARGRGADAAPGSRGSSRRAALGHGGAKTTAPGSAWPATEMRLGSRR